VAAGGVGRVMKRVTSKKQAKSQKNQIVVNYRIYYDKHRDYTSPDLIPLYESWVKANTMGHKLKFIT